MSYSLVDALSGKNSNRDDLNVNFLSPRFAPLMPDKVAGLVQFTWLLDYLTILNQHFTDCVNHGDHNNFSNIVCLKPASSTYLLLSSLHFTLLVNQFRCQISLLHENKYIIPLNLCCRRLIILSLAVTVNDSWIISPPATFADDLGVDRKVLLKSEKNGIVLGATTTTSSITIDSIVLQRRQPWQYCSDSKSNDILWLCNKLLNHWL